MTVTTFLLVLFSLLVGGGIGVALYNWYLERVLKKSIESLIADTMSDLDFHTVTLNDGKTLTVSKSTQYAGQYIIVLQHGAKSSVVHFDANTLEVLDHGTIDC